MSKMDKIAKLEIELAAAQRRSSELKAQLASAMGAAFDAMPKTADFKGSCVILTVTALGGKELVAPVAIHDGLSLATIAALQDDLRRSFELATMVSAAMAR